MKKLIIAGFVASTALTGAAFAQDSSSESTTNEEPVNPQQEYINDPNDPMAMGEPIGETVFEEQGADATDQQFEGTVIVRDMYDEESQSDVRRIYRVNEDGSRTLIAETEVNSSDN